MAAPPISEAGSQLDGTQASAQIEAARQQQLDDFRKNAALSALMQTHGPAAGDPDVWLKAEQAQAAQDEEPAVGPTAQADLQTKQLANTQTQQEQQGQALYKGIQLFKTQVQPNPDGSYKPEDYQKFFGNPLVQKITGLAPDQVQQFQPLITGPGGAQHLDAVARAALGPQKLTGAFSYGTDQNGNSVGIGHDDYGNAIVQPLNGVTPTAVTNAQSSQGRLAERVQQDAYLRAHGWTQAQIQEYRASTQAQNSTYGAGDGQTLPNIPQTAAGGVPTEQPGVPTQAAAPSPHLQITGVQARAAALLKRYNGNPDAAIQNAPDDATAMAVADQAAPKPQQPAAQPKSYIDTLPPKGRQIAIGQAQHLVDQGTNLQNTNAILGQVERQITPYTTGAGSLLSALPGTLQKNLKANLETLSAQGLTSWIQSLKNTQGQTGIGRVLQTEANAASRIYGNMEQAQTASQLAYHAKLFGLAVNKLYDHARAAYQAQWRTNPEATLGLPTYQKAGGATPQQYTPQQRAVLQKYGVQ